MQLGIQLTNISALGNLSRAKGEKHDTPRIKRAQNRAA